MRKSFLEAVQPDLRQKFACARLGIFAVHLARFRLEHDVAERGAPVEQDRTLKNDADVGARPVDGASDQVGEALHGPIGRRHPAVDA